MRAEIAALASLDSPYIIRIFEFAEDPRAGVLSAQALLGIRRQGWKRNVQGYSGSPREPFR